MGIFEQYGIKDVMDVTLYAIAENKYGEEIYVPLIYFDTLKVSDIQQAAEQTSARGGLGNSHQIFWDYNKEIKIDLTDALYTPSNQSLTWGNYLGIKPLKLKGIWQPREYQIKKVVVDNVPSGEEDKYIKFVCPCDNIFKYYTYVDEGNEPIKLAQKQVKYKNNIIYLDGSPITDIQDFNGEFSNKLIKGELVIKNFLDFSESYAEYKNVNVFTHWRLLNWSDCEGEIITNQDSLAIDDIDLAVFSNENTDNKMFLIRRYSENESWSSEIEVYKKVYKKLIGLGDNNQPVEKYLELDIHVGNFYIIEDWNINISEKETIPYGIDLNYNSVPYLDKIEKLYADKDFKIDTNKNIKAYNAFLIKNYERNNLTCYIDPLTMRPYQANDASLKDDIPQSYHYFKKGDFYLKKTRSQSTDSKRFLQTIVNAKQFNGLFKIVGETYTKDRVGEYQHYQVEIPRCRMSTANQLSLAADGEPCTVSMSFIALPDYKDDLISITRYEKEVIDKCEEKYTRPIVSLPAAPPPPTPAQLHIEILYPKYFNNIPNSGILCIPNDCRVADRQAYENGGSRLIAPSTEAAARHYGELYNNRKWDQLPKDLLLVGLYNENNELIRYLLKSEINQLIIKNEEVER